MKKLLLLLTCLAISASAISQVPAAFTYQAIVRNSAGEIVVNKNVSFRISIIQDSETGTAVYAERHTAVTNAFGLVSLAIGKGSVLSGIFSPGGWGLNKHFVKVELDPEGGSTYTHLGTMQILSVPYAFHARTVEIDKVDDADADPSNEIQKIDISGTVLTLSRGGGSVTLPTSGSGGDNWGTQTVVTNNTLNGNGTTSEPLGVSNTVIQPSWANVLNKPAGFADNVDDVNDADNNPANEIQTLSLTGNKLSISSGNTVTLPETSGDDWGKQVVVSDATLAGNGTAASPLGIADNAVSTAKVGNLAITTEKLGNGAVTGAKINQSGATAGQALKWNGTIWAPADDVTGGGGLTLPFNGSANTGIAAFHVTNTGAGTGIHGEGATAVKGESSASEGHGIYGRNSSTSGTNYGVYGVSNSTGGRGVFGGTTSLTGSACGVKGESSSTSGFGVLGVALASSGSNYGVMGSTYSSSGYGVYGEAYTSGTNYGVYGISRSATGFGTCGETTSSSGACNGVYGVTSSSAGRGVYGLASSTSGQNFGVRGTSQSSEGIAVYGNATATSGQPFGIIGHTVAPYGTAIFGHADASSGSAIAVRAESYSSAGYGVHGTAWNTTGKNYGGYFETASSSGYGIWATGPKYGIYGVSTGSSSARAIIGEAKGTGSIGVMGLGLEASSTGVWGEGANYDFYANGPGTNYGSSSSIRWKRNIVPIPEPLEKIDALRGVYFDWDTNHGGKHDIGFIAEEVGRVLPEIVVYEENGIDASGLDYSKITPLLLEAVKALKAENELLKARLEKIETLIGKQAEK